MTDSPHPTLVKVHLLCNVCGWGDFYTPDKLTLTPLEGEGDGYGDQVQIAFNCSACGRYDWVTIE